MFYNRFILKLIFINHHILDISIMDNFISCNTNRYLYDTFYKYLDIPELFNLISINKDSYKKKNFIRRLVLVNIKKWFIDINGHAFYKYFNNYSKNKNFVTDYKTYYTLRLFSLLYSDEHHHTLFIIHKVMPYIMNNNILCKFIKKMSDNYMTY